MSTTGAKTIRIKLPYPHPGQQAVQLEAKRFNWLSAGRRWRKTTLAMAIAVEAAVAGETLIWGAPTYDEVRIGWDETKRAVGAAVDFHQQRMTADFPGGGKIVYRSLKDPDNARGKTAHGAVLDEVGYIKRAAWYEVIRPMLLDTNGWAWGLGTPNGRNWFWAEHSAARDRDDTMAWQVPTLGCVIDDGRLIREPHPLENPDIPFEELEQMYREMPELAFRQEILAEFVEDSAGVFRGVRQQAILSRGRHNPEHVYVMGVDWGKYQDFTVFTVIDATTKQVAALYRTSRIDYRFQLEQLKTLYEEFNPVVIVAEANAVGDVLIERMIHEEGLPVEPFVTTNRSKKDAIEGLALAIERSEIELLSDPVLVAELEAMQTQRLPSGLLRYSAPEGTHDDCVISLALAWHGITAPRQGTRSRRAA